LTGTGSGGNALGAGEADTSEGVGGVDSKECVLNGSWCTCGVEGYDSRYAELVVGLSETESVSVSSR